MSVDDIVQQIGQTEGFPELPSLAMEIARMTTDLSAPVQEIADKIQLDVQLLRKMLRVVSEPFYGLSGGLGKIADAISLIGYQKVCNLAVAVSILDLFPTKAEGGFDYGGFWERSLCSAVAAGEIGNRITKDLQSDAFSLGLLQDIGVLFLVRSRPLEYGGAIGVSSSQNLHIAKAERDVLDVDHAVVGAAMCKHWRLPGFIGEAIQHHHFAEFEESVPADSKTITQVVNLSSLVTAFLYADGRHEEEARRILDERGKEFFGFGPKMIDAIIEKVPSQAKDIGKAFSIDVGADAKEATAAQEESFHEECPHCKAKDQTGKFCSECGGALLVEKKKPKVESHKVLIAEDSIASRRALIFVIKKLGYIPIEATNGVEAVEMAKKDLPGMILLDVMMPRMTGLEALKRIREDEATAEIPIVMLTSMTDSETVVEAVQGGANDYVVKPYTADLIAQRLKKYMPAPKKKKK